MAYLYFVHIADGMVELHWTTLVQICLRTLKDIRADTSQVVHRPRASCGTCGWLQKRSSTSCSSDSRGILQLRDASLFLLVECSRRSCRGLLGLLVLVLIVMFLRLILALLTVNPATHHAIVWRI